MDRAYAEARMRWEPLHEMTQIKGDEETHPFLSPEDEFADFESWDVSNISGSRCQEGRDAPDRSTRDQRSSWVSSSDRRLG